MKDVVVLMWFIKSTEDGGCEFLMSLIGESSGAVLRISRAYFRSRVCVSHAVAAKGLIHGAMSLMVPASLS